MPSKSEGGVYYYSPLKKALLRNCALRFRRPNFLAESLLELVLCEDLNYTIKQSISLLQAFSVMAVFYNVIQSTMRATPFSVSTFFKARIGLNAIQVFVTYFMNSGIWFYLFIRNINCSQWNYGIGGDFVMILGCMRSKLPYLKYCFDTLLLVKYPNLTCTLQKM